MKKRGDFATDSRVLYLVGICIGIGIMASFGALVLVNLINFFTNIFFFGKLSLAQAIPAANQLGAYVILIPVLGGLLVGLIARFGSERIRGHGIPEAIEAILFGKSIVQAKVAVFKPIASAIAIGSGGPFGAEGPIIMTGGAVGSLVAQLFHLTSAERKTLLVAGAAAGMSAIFAAPIAAIFLAVELLLFELKPRSLIPVAAASVAAALMRPYLLGNGPVFALPINVDATLIATLSCCIVGIIGGFFSGAMSKLLYSLEDMFHSLPIHWSWWCAIGGLAVGIGGYLEPRALGVGYDVIEDLLHMKILPQAVLTILLVKGLIWGVALASGTSGGVLAPLLMMGCGLGVIESIFLPESLKELYPLISMAAIMSGMMRVPFTSLMFALELTQNYAAAVPIFVACISSYAVTVLFMKRSILTEKISRRGGDVFREYGIDPLETKTVGSIMTADVKSINSNLEFSSIVADYFNGKTKFRGYPVLDNEGNLQGLITASDLLGVQLDDPQTNASAQTFGHKPVITITVQQSCREAAEKMAQFGIGRLPVVAENDDQKLVGIITRSDLLKPRLSHNESEEKREKIITFL